MRNLLKKNPRYSKRINYDALRDLFDGGAPPGSPAGDAKLDVGADLWTLDAEKDDDAMVVIEEGGGGVGMSSAKARVPSRDAPALPEEDGAADADGEDDAYAYASDKGEEFGEWDVYEQEV